MPDLKDREIFATGKWNGIDFTEQDLDDIADNFNKLSDIHKVPLKFGHNDEQKITDGQPALGWVSRVYRKGTKLLADFSDVPTIVVEAIKKRLYRNVSVELLFNVDNKGNKFNHVLDAVAILGADHPAVNTLADLDTLLATRAEFSGGHRVTFSTVRGNLEEEDKAMPDEKLEKLQASVDKLLTKVEDQDEKIDELQKSNSALEKENARLKADKEKADDEAKQQKIAATRDSIKKVLDAAVRKKSFTPSAREVYARQIGLEDDDKVLDIDIEEVRAMCSVKEEDMEEKPRARITKDDDEIDFDNPSEELLRLTREHQEKHGVESFDVAFGRVCRANVKLHKAYLDSNGTKEG